MGYNGSGGLMQASGDIFAYELLAKFPVVKSYHFCFTLVPWESNNNNNKNNNNNSYMSS